MEQQAQQQAQIVCSRIIVQDNGLIQLFQEFQQLWRPWKKPGFIYIFVAQVGSEMNPIELQWQQIKKDELAGEIFDSESELAQAVIHGVEVK